MRVPLVDVLGDRESLVDIDALADIARVLKLKYRGLKLGDASKLGNRITLRKVGSLARDSDRRSIFFVDLSDNRVDVLRLLELLIGLGGDLNRLRIALS